MSEVIKPPNPVNFEDNMSKIFIFLGGSISDNKADPWQEKITKEIEKIDKDNIITILNPRRDNWDSSWKNTPEDKNFNEQVLWELNCQEECDWIIYYIDPKTQSPITLMEIGAFGMFEDCEKHILVCCPDGFWKKGNVEVFCNRYEIPLFTTFDELVNAIRESYEIARGEMDG